MLNTDSHFLLIHQNQLINLHLIFSFWSVSSCVGTHLNWSNFAVHLCFCLLLLHDLCVTSNGNMMHSSELWQPYHSTEDACCLLFTVTSQMRLNLFWLLQFLVLYWVIDYRRRWGQITNLVCIFVSRYMVFGDSTDQFSYSALKN